MRYEKIRQLSPRVKQTARLALIFRSRQRGVRHSNATAREEAPILFSMARTLPWLKDASTHSKVSTTRAPKRQRIQDTAGDSESSSTPARLLSLKAPRNAASRSADRNPSTSPPPPPQTPPSTSPMRPGLAKDDIYIMVEDEFLSTARLYTQHLHHAEYMRLKKVAATRKTSPAAHPIDSITKMREETKRRKEAEKYARRVKGGIEEMMGAVEARLPADTQEGAESDREYEEEERMDAPGIGTVLGDLMKEGPRKGSGRLGGLESVKSSTRAAAGYGKMENSPRRNGKDVFRPFGRAVENGVEMEEDGSTDHDDDLDAPVMRRSKASPGTRPPLKPPSSSIYPPPTSNKLPISNGATASSSHKPNKVAFDPSHTPSGYPPASKPPISARTPAPPHKPLKPPLLDDDVFARPSNAQTDAIRRRMQARRKREQEEQRKEKAIDVDEIPIFLV